MNFCDIWMYRRGYGDRRTCRTGSGSLPFLIFLMLLLAGTGLATPGMLHGQDLQRSPGETMRTALRMFQEGLYAQSVPLFRQVIEEDPNSTLSESAGYHLVLATVRSDSTRLEEMTEWFVHEHPDSRRSGELLTDLGEYYRQRGEYRLALNQYERALHTPMTDRRRVELLYRLAETAVDDGSPEEARGWFLTLADRFPDSPWAPRALYARGRLWLEEEQFDRASEAFELLRNRYPDDPMTRRIGTALGESYYLQRRYEEAIDAFQEAMSWISGESQTRAVYLMAESYNMLNRLEEAQQYYRFYLNRVEDEDRARIAHYGLGWVFHKMEIYHWAASSFAMAAEGEDEMARKALYYKAVNEKLAGRIRSALESLRLFGQKYREGLFVEQAWYEWALIAVEVGLYEEAIEILQPLARRLDTLENPGQVIILLGEAYYGNGEYTRAMEAFEVASGMTQVDPLLKLQAMFQRAWVQYSNQAYLQAQPQFEQVHRAAPDADFGAEALFWSADSHYELRNWGPAATQYARFVELYPDHELTGAAKYALGWSWFMLGDFEKAIPPFRDFMENYEPPSIALYPYETDVQLRIGDSYFALGEYDMAMQYYNMAIGAEPGGDYAMYQVANSYYRMNRNFEAVSEFRRLLRIYPFSTLREQAQYNVAYIYLNTGNYEQSIQEFRTVIERFPGTEWAARAQYNIGDAWYNAGNYEEAIAAYRAVLEEYPRSNYILEAIDGIQYAQLSAGREDSSTVILEEFLNLNPASSTADQLRYRQAENRYQSGDYRAAVEEFRQYIRITNRTDLLPDAWFNLADSWMNSGNREEAVESYRTLVEQFPRSERAAAALVRLGEIAYEDGDHAASFNYFQQLEERGGRFSRQARQGMGEASLALGNPGQAREYFESILRESPGDPAARLGLGNVLFAEGRYAEAREIFTAVAGESSTETGAEAQYMLGRSWQMERRYDEALDAYSRVNVLFEAYIDRVADAMVSSAEIHILEGRRGDAIRILNEVTERYPGTGGASRAARLLNRN